MSKRAAYFFVITAAFCWGLIGFFIKTLNGYGFTSEQIVWIRAVGAAFTLVIVSAFRDPKLFLIQPRDAFYFVGTGLFSFAFFNWCYFTAIHRTSLSVAAILLYTAPAWVMVLSAILFGEKITARKMASLLLTFAGCVLITAFVRDPGREMTAAGVLAGLGAGLGYALYSIFGRYALRKYNSTTITLYTFLFAAIGLIPITDVGEMAALFSKADANAWYLALTLGLVATALPYLLYTKGLSCLETGRASIVATMEPIVATAIGILLYGEPVTFFKIAGISLVVFAVSLIREGGGDRPK